MSQQERPRTGRRVDGQNGPSDEELAAIVAAIVDFMRPEATDCRIASIKERGVAAGQSPWQSRSLWALAGRQAQHMARRTRS